MKVIFIFLFYICNHVANCTDGYSFHKFSGPVSGQIQEVYVQADENSPARTVDYIAKPDYVYSYGVEDPQTANSQTHEESRDGDTVHGEYRVAQPDGMVRIVRYTADPKNGFQAHVEYATAQNVAQQQQQSSDDDD